MREKTRRTFIIIIIVIFTSLFAFLIIRSSIINGGGIFSYYDTEGNFHQGKTFWDWLELLIIPFSISLTAILFNFMEKRNEFSLVKEKMWDQTLNEYINSITNMIQGGKINKDSPIEQITIARVKTLAALRMLDGGRKGVLINFLYEAGLIGGEGEDHEENHEFGTREPIISLKGADLSFAYLTGDFKIPSKNASLGHITYRGINLFGIDLSGANLSYAILDNAELSGSNFESANCVGASFKKCSLWETNFQNTDCTNASFRKAYFNRADFSNTNFENADLSLSYIYNSRFVSYYCPSPEGFSQKAILKKANLNNSDLMGSLILPTQIIQAKTYKNLFLPDGSIACKYSLIKIDVSPVPYYDDKGTITHYARSPEIKYYCPCGKELDPYSSPENQITADDSMLNNLWTTISIHIKESHPKKYKISEYLKSLGK